MLQLFYQQPEQRNAEVELHITSAGRRFEDFFVDDHRDEYDHTDDSLHPKHHGGSCFCDLPDPTDPKWPKLFDNYKFLASGVEAILALDISAIPDTPLPHEIKL
jgi:hypothetical protein